MFSGLRLPFFKKKSAAGVASAVPAPAAASGELSKTPRMQSEYPSVRHLAINLTIRPPYNNEMEATLNNRSFGPNAVASFSFRCKNIECRGGGFDLGDAIEEAVAKKLPSIAGRRICQGSRAGAQFQEHSCHYELNFKANISYHDEN
ncbi:MAG: hypothetical protein AAGD86_11525 [Pseudomonadota bacterium]